MRFEIRRLHDEYRYTTVYVTHDQSEAMTTADVIAVMNAGRIEQAGSPEEVYERPQSEFVARFIGSSNVVKGQVLDESHLSCAGGSLRCTGRLTPGREGAIAIRQHAVRLWPSKPDNMENVLAGTVTRQVFLGASRDYLVEMVDGTQLRVVASAAESLAQGSVVWLQLPPDRCRVLTR
jgi:iron(III) transport system ATP-binding protein